ncbi:hypothetical protein JHN52_33055 [Streptomyces sp. MBT97]|uniref:hypothetical protein n=1 Tax=Streptomyces sp. MBT97 TaxID=2800411 RepID=UPI00190B0549|nr:hypothetical protein [Streptomyces sp. MBT97]MBK3637641.1 hypothetical protein [Streptomyces sp. MBT97]
MEQRIGSSSQPLEGAGFDPAFIPGLTSPVTAKPEDAGPAGNDGDDAAVPEEEKGEPAASRRPDAPGDDTDAPDAADEPVDEPVDGPVFEAADRRARITADARGVRLRLDEESCEFRWDEIGAVETESPRFGKRFTVTVHTPDRRWYPIEIEATARARFQEWEEQLDAVLDAYFEEGGPDAEDPSDDAGAEGGGAAEDADARNAG